MAAWQRPPSDSMTRSQQACARIEEQATELACELVPSCSDASSAMSPRQRRTLVSRVLAVIPSTDSLVAVHLPPSTVTAPAAQALVDLGVRSSPTPPCDPGDAVVEPTDHVLDLRISSALDRVSEVLA